MQRQSKWAGWSNSASRTGLRAPNYAQRKDEADDEGTRRQDKGPKGAGARVEEREAVGGSEDRFDDQIKGNRRGDLLGERN
jgi:hypothetical protein